MMKNNFDYTVYLHIPWNTRESILSDDAELEPTYTVGP